MSDRTFTIGGKLLVVTNVESGHWNGPDDEWTSIKIGGGVYTKDAQGHTHWTGESFDGRIPYADLIAWALEKGYMHWEQKEVRL